MWVCVCVCVCVSVTVVAEDLHTTTHGSAKNMNWTTGPFLRQLARRQSCPSEQCARVIKHHTGLLSGSCHKIPAMD